jgi:SAM-dependent methyltransferase
VWRRTIHRVPSEQSELGASGLAFEIYGFDVHDSGVQESGFLCATTERLSSCLPGIPWHDHLRLIDSREAWPYSDGFFDFIVSNQVLEHVADPMHFLAQVKRCLVKGGCSAHLFPLKNVILEGHLLLPFVHWIRNHDLLIAVIRLFSRMGMGKYWGFHRRNRTELNDFSIRHADYLHYFTWYSSYRDFLYMAKIAGLRASFRYTREFYTSKLRRSLGMDLKWLYSTDRNALRDWWSVKWLSYLSCVTLFLENEETYRESPLPIHGNKAD